MTTDRAAYRHHSRAVAPSSLLATTCDNESIGVIISDPQGRTLMITRATPPLGRAPVAGHLDDHGTAEDAARNEVSEEVGLTVTTLTMIIPRHWRDNICRRRAGPLGVGHYWTVFEATATGEIDTDPAEAVDARWYTRTELQELADQTVAYANGALSTERFTAAPGLQPVWMTILKQRGLIRISDADLTAARTAARHLPGAVDVNAPPGWSPPHPTG